MNVEQIRSSGVRTLEERAHVFAALGDPVRLAIVEMLRDEDVAPHVLGTSLAISSNLLAHHLRVLEAAGLVTRNRSQGDGRRSYVSLREDVVNDLLVSAAALSVRRVVFVCTRNSARSILAESIWRTASEIPATSAGTHPADAIHPRTRRAATRAHLTIERDNPQSVDDVLRADDLVISVCDAVHEELTELPNRRMHWSVPDPVREDTDAAFSAVVHELTQRIHAFAPRVRPARARRSAS